MMVRKLVVSDGRTERELLLIGTIVVGRDPSCQLNDLDPLLSRRHAEFVPTGKGVTVRDLKSRNGILVNGDKVPERVLKPGDVIQLGHLHVRYVEEPVVKSPEDHTRVRAKTETDIEVPTMALPPRVASPPAASREAEAAPTVSAPAMGVGDDTDLDVTIAPAARAAASSPAHAPAARVADEPDVDATMAPAAHRSTPAPAPSVPPADRHADDLDATVAPSGPRPAASHTATPPTAGADDLDSTRVPRGGKASAVADDPDATMAATNQSFDETRMPSVAARPGRATEARIVANMSLVVTEASPSCQTVIGARPDTIVGGQLGEVLARTLRFVATGDGPSAISLTIARAATGNTITVTFKAGQTENHS